MSALQALAGWAEIHPWLALACGGLALSMLTPARTVVIELLSLLADIIAGDGDSRGGSW